MFMIIHSLANLGEIQEIQQRMGIQFRPFQERGLLLLLETFRDAFPGHPTLDPKKQPRDCPQPKVLV